MKLFYLTSILTLLSIFSFGQQTITSVSSGNANNPLVWDCLCFPGFNDDIIINHDIVMNVDWIVNNGGSITINASGSFTEDAQNRAILIDGAGSVFQNNGTTELTNIAITNSAIGYNTSSFILDSGLFIGANSEYHNTGVISSLDSLLNEGYFFNGSGASLDLGDFLNIGDMLNDGFITTDSLGNTGTLTSNGNMDANAFGNTGNWSQFGDLSVTTDFYNAGTMYVDAIADIFVGNDFFNGDTIGGAAELTNNGGVAVNGDFYNAQIMSGSGRFCVAGNSTNAGTASGTFDFCDQSPSGGVFDLNLGSVSPTITNCVSPCAIGMAELPLNQINVSPNPANDYITLITKDYSGFVNVKQVNLNGQIIQDLSFDSKTNATIKLVGSNGIYLLKVTSSEGKLYTTRIAKN